MTTRALTGAAMPTAQPARLAIGDIWIIVGTTLVLPLAVPFVLAVASGSVLRMAYPAYVLGLSLAYVSSSRRWLFPVFILSIFAFDSFLRRMADYGSGFALFNLIIVGPYLGIVPMLPALARRLLGQRPGPVWPFIAIVLLMTYSIFVAILNGAALVSALYEPVRWLLPVALCAFIMDRPEEVDAIYRSLILALSLIVPIHAVYGVYQYVVAPGWDVLWMININNPTFGVAEPFKIRVFGMMNSPFSGAVFGAMSMILLGGAGLVPLAIAVLGLPALALTLDRTGWVGLAIGLGWLLYSAPPSRKLVLITGSVVVAFTATALLASPVIAPDVANKIMDRFGTLQDLRSDGSANVRLDVYANLYDRLADHPFGEGFGVNESIVTISDRKKNQPLDSGFLEAFLIYGVLGGCVYFAAVVALVKRALAASRRAPKRLSGPMAVVVSMWVMSLLGASQIAEVGALGWAALGIVLAHGLTEAKDRSVRAAEPYRSGPHRSEFGAPAAVRPALPGIRRPSVR